MRRELVILAAGFVTLLVTAYALSVEAARSAPYPRRIAHTMVNKSMEVPLKSFSIAVGRYPTTAEGLTALISAPAGTGDRWRGPYIKSSGTGLPRDPWNHQYRYRCPGIHNPDHYDLWSLGHDGIESADDIGNWEQ